MKIGFTGTRNGMTREQRESVATQLARLNPTEAHHGDCIGSDQEFSGLAHASIRASNIVVHPPEKNDLRANSIRPGNQVRLPKSYFARNRDIVDETDLLIATPPANEELTQGGTWYTINYARKRNKPVVICWPDGRVTTERVAHPAPQASETTEGW